MIWIPAVESEGIVIHFVSEIAFGVLCLQHDYMMAMFSPGVNWVYIFVDFCTLIWSPLCIDPLRDNFIPYYIYIVQKKIHNNCSLPSWKPPDRPCLGYAVLLVLASVRGNVESSFTDFQPTSNRHTWISAVKRKNWSPNEYSMICSSHFVSGEYSLQVTLTGR